MRTALLVLLLSAAGMGKGYAYDFSSVCSTGQTLYYNIIDATNRYVEVTSPSNTYPYYDGFDEPIGDLVLEENVEYEDVDYSVVSIGENSFRGCSGLASASIPSTVSSIEDLAFYFSSLMSVSIPNSVVTIGDYAFGACSSLASVIIPNSVTTIGEYAFSGCDCLTTLNIPNSVNFIGDNAFGCKRLEQITVDADNQCYDSREGCNAIIETNTNTLIRGCKNTIIPNSVTIIGDYAFQNCENLTSFIIPSCVTSIGYAAFRACVDLKSIVIPYAVTSIGDYAFQSCYALTSINIPNSVTSIGDGVFRYCGSLTSIIIPNSVTSIGDYAFEYCGLDIISLAITHPVLGNSAFGGVPCTTLIVSCGSKEDYEASEWANFFTTIEEDCASYGINIEEDSFSGGDINTSVNSTTMGEEVQLTITPDEGMYLASLMVCNVNNPEQTVSVYPIGKTSSLYGFIMPPFDVVVTAVFAPITSVDENNAVEVLTYPNPTNGQVRIEAEGLKHITISNMLGQTVYEGSANGNAFEYDFGKHGAGLYLVGIETASGVAVKKVSVVK